MQLFLENGLQLRRDTFVKTEFRYELSWRLLTPYDDTGREFKLHSAALRELMVFLHTPYLKPHDIEPELALEAEELDGETCLGDEDSNADRRLDLDKVNPLQAQLLIKHVKPKVTNCTAGSFSNRYKSGTLGCAGFWRQVMTVICCSPSQHLFIIQS